MPPSILYCKGGLPPDVAVMDMVPSEIPLQLGSVELMFTILPPPELPTVSVPDPWQPSASSKTIL